MVAGLAEGTAVKVRGTFTHVEAILNPQRLKDLNEHRLSHLVVALRKNGLAETTIKGYLAHFKAALNWAVQQKLLSALPGFPKLQRAKRYGGSAMKGRPITAEEFERMLEAIPAVVHPEQVPQWAYYLRGLWTSGLRLGESLDLWWDRYDRMRPIFPKNGRPLFEIHAELEKGHTDRLLPMAPEFALLLQQTPEQDRSGPVFRLQGRQGRYGQYQVSKTVSRIGRAAGVTVHVDPRDSSKVKVASAHDLRRAFGERWAARVMPAQLMELMRHESIETTLRFYVGTNAQRTNDAIWSAFQVEQGRPSGGFPDISPDMALGADFSRATPQRRSAPENTGRKQTRPGQIRTGDQGIMSPLL